MFGSSELNEVYSLELEDGSIAYTGRIGPSNDPDAIRCNEEWGTPLRNLGEHESVDDGSRTFSFRRR